MSRKLWCIKNIETGLFWDNMWGWVDDMTESTMDIFTDEEKQELNLPIGGEWCLFE